MCSYKNVLKICSKFTGENPCGSVILIKLICKFVEITLRHGCSPVNLLHNLWTLFPKNTSGWLLLFDESFCENRSWLSYTKISIVDLWLGPKYVFLLLVFFHFEEKSLQFKKVGKLLLFATVLTGSWTQEVNWTYIRCSEDVLYIFWTPYVRSIYVLWQGAFDWYKMCYSDQTAN